MAGRQWRRPEGAPRAQHFLGSASLAEEIVRTADLARDDLVVEFGAGYGRLTEFLASRAGRVIAVEIDARLAARLEHRFRTRSHVTVLSGDLLITPLPHQPFRVVSNLPFNLTSALVHRLDDPGVPLRRADLVVAWGAALALTGVFGPAHKARPWSLRYEFLLVRRLPATLFEPAPGTDAALISIRPRPRHGG